jgi:hypothetical protein
MRRNRAAAVGLHDGESGTNAAVGASAAKAAQNGAAALEKANAAASTLATRLPAEPP